MTAAVAAVVAVIAIAAVAAVAARKREAHFLDLDRRSGEFADQIIAALPHDGDAVPIAQVLPADVALQSKRMCFLPPYSGFKSIPELKDVDFGADATWLSSVDEGWFGVVTVDNQGGLLNVIRLRRSKVDILPYSLAPECHYVSEKVRFVRAGLHPEGILQVTVGTER